MIDWTKQHCGIHQAPYEKVLELMPDLSEIMATFPDVPTDFTWDIKVHMLMPRQYPCIPHWHTDNVPRIDGIQRFDLIRLEKPMYMWISGGPLTQFKHGFILPQRWVRFNQTDEHRGTAAAEFCWRAFIRASHKDILPPKASDFLRRHCQVYVDEDTCQW